MARDSNVEQLERIYADWARGDYRREDIFDPEVEFVTDFPDRSTYHGPEGIRRGWNEFLAAWDDFTTKAEKIIPIPGSEGRYVVLVHLRGIGKESRVPIDALGANIVRIRDGKLLYFELVRDRDAALRRVGLSDR